MKEVRVRFAPSPTGFLHVGGARTAIFNWLFAKSQKGRFLLRIEDTDPERSKSELSAQILRSMDWLELTSDEPVVYQSDNLQRHKEVVAELIRSGKAYYAFETAEELEAIRKQNPGTFMYNRAALNLSRETVDKFIADGKEYVVRFFVPKGNTEFDDMVHGRTSFNNAELDDFVILRSDGTPTYHIAVVTDDHDMNITHVIRGDDHLSNTPKQILLYRALGWDEPKFAHLPLIYDEQKKKLSKRRNTVSVEEYKSHGYLHEALFNFLTLLGYAPAGNKEIISKDELVEEFTFDRVNRKSAVFDMNKLNWINTQYIKSANELELAPLLRELLIKAEVVNAGDKNKFSDEYIAKVIRVMKERVTTLGDYIKDGMYFFEEPGSYDETGMKKHWNVNIKSEFTGYCNIVSDYNEFPGAQKMESDLREFADKNGTKAAALIHPLRLALTGRTASPGVFEVAEVLGISKIKQRISNFITYSA